MKRPARPEMEPEKPVSEMTDEERAAYVQRIRTELRAFGRSKRQRRIRQGRASPRTYAEMREFARDLLARQEDEASG